MRQMLIAIAVALTAALAVSSTGHAAGSAAAVKTRHGKLGTFLVDGHGRTLYLFQKDKTAKSRCSGACANDWPPVLTTRKTTSSGSARKALLGTSRRSDGTMQVTYKGHPLYTYAGDAKAGDTNGQGVSAFGARWYAVTPSGKRVGARY